HRHQDRGPPRGLRHDRVESLFGLGVSYRFNDLGALRRGVVELDELALVLAVRARVLLGEREVDPLVAVGDLSLLDRLALKQFDTLGGVDRRWAALGYEMDCREVAQQ